MQDDDPLEDRLGTTMGSWRLERLLGAGGMAAVYLGRRDDGQQRAIKVLHPQVARDRNLRARFAQELDAVARLQHPTIVRVDDMGATDDGSPFIVMELLEGETLHARLRRGLPTLAEALAITDDLLDGLIVAHAGRIIHRDIKPENVFLSTAGLRILDFGIAKVERESIARVKTETGTMLGTPSYMAQEQIKGLDVDHRVDVFAVGAVLFKMLTGRLIHDEPDANRRLMKMLTTPAPPLCSLGSQFSKALGSVVDRALAFEPHDRYPSAAVMQGDVRALRAGLAPPYATSVAPLAQAAYASTSQAMTTSNEPSPTMATRVGGAVTPPDASRGRGALLVVIVLSVLAGVLLVILLSTL